MLESPGTAFRLRRFRADALSSEGDIEVDVLGQLPSSSESLAISGNNRS